jgi:hypothetical protein
VKAAVEAAVTADKKANTIKPLGKIEVDEESRAAAQREVEAAGYGWYYLSRSRYIQDARWGEPKYVAASPQAQRKVMLTNKIVRVDRVTQTAKAVARPESPGLTRAPAELPVDNRPHARTHGVPTAALYHEQTVAPPGVAPAPVDANDVVVATGAPITPPAGPVPGNVG